MINVEKYLKQYYKGSKELEDLSINLKGNFQIQNASICLETIRILQNKGYETVINNIKNLIY